MFNFSIIAAPSLILLMACSSANFGGPSDKKEDQAGPHGTISKTTASSTTTDPNQTSPQIDGEGSNRDDNIISAADTEQKIFLDLPGGVPGGHFDLDTSISTYPFNQGKTAHHVHEYDDRFNVTGVDFFNLKDTKFIDPRAAARSEQSFTIIIANAEFSPGAMLLLNGNSLPALEWQKTGQNNKTTVFSFHGNDGTTKLDSFMIYFDKNRPISEQLIASETKRVVSNTPGPNNTYRAGALTVQLLDAKTGQLDPTLGVAAIGQDGLIWEATLFWHHQAKDDSD